MRITVILGFLVATFIGTASQGFARDQSGSVNCGQAPKCSASRECQNRKQAYNACRSGQSGNSSDEK